jgi:nicotinate-nucleotide--dimethylbenzimidazole phosphoribosyltransferase
VGADVSDPAVLRHVIGAIGPASRAQGEAARRCLARAGLPLLERLAEALGAAQHTGRPRGRHRTIVVVAGDHGVGDPGVALGAAHPTAVAAHAIASGAAALAHLARAAAAPIVLVDAGTREPAALPATAIRLGRGPSRDLRVEPAMTIVDAALAVEAGIALAVSLADAGLDVLALGAIGVGAEVASAALLGAALGTPVTGLGDPEAEAASVSGARYARAGAPADAGPRIAPTARVGALEQLAALGGPDTAVMTGLILASASMNIPVILDGYATSAAALAAVAFAPAARDYLIAAHVGTFTQPRILAHLGLRPLYDVGLGHGEGSGAAMVLPLIDQVTALAAAEYS